MTQSQTLARLQAEAAAAQTRLDQALGLRRQRVGHLAESAGLIDLDDDLLAGAFAELADAIKAADDTRKTAWKVRGEPFRKRTAAPRRRAPAAPAAPPADPGPAAPQPAGSDGPA